MTPIVNNKKPNKPSLIVIELLKHLQLLLARFKDDHDGDLEPFSIKGVKKALGRIYTIVTPWLLCFHKLNSIYDWDNKLVTVCMASLYFIIWYHDLLLTFLMGWIVITVVLIRVDISLDASLHHPTIAWKKWMVQQVAVPFDYQVFIEKHGPFIQKLIMEMADYLERFKNLFCWKKPMQTSIVLAGMMVSTMISIQVIIKIIFFYIGIEFFVLHALRCHYPKYRRLFNVLEWLLLDIPADDDHDDMKGLVNNTAIKEGMESTHKSIHKSDDTKSTMVFLASANFTHKLLHSDNKKKKKKNKKQVEKLLKSDDPNVFGCVYKDHPGFLRLEGNGFTFMTNQKRLVAVAWQDVVNMIKSDKKGILISIKDGVLLTFEPVMNRDACFRQLYKNLFQ